MTTLVRCAAGTEILDRTCEALLGSDIHAGMSELRLWLRSLRAELTPEEWKEVGQEARCHPVHDLLLESPFTRRAFAKPRGYAGDAVLMDLIYGMTAPAGVSAIGGALYGYEFDSPCFQSVRTRRAVLAHELDEIAATRRNARALSVACGHLREVEWSRAVRNGQVSVTAIDQDRESLDLVDRAYARYGVSAKSATVGDLVRRTVRFSDLDLIYAAGLYDYLEDGIAHLLTAALFRMLRPGGRLLVANFTPDTCDAAFMEAVMDWQLVYRSTQAMRALTASIPEQHIATTEDFTDAKGNITYLRVVKQ